ncbi:MAG: hypothetical protein ACO3A4_07380 [Silvanigrellaceae bacterium]
MLKACKNRNLQSTSRLSIQLTDALKSKGLTEEQAKIITDAAKQKADAKKGTSSLSLARADTPAELEIAGFVEGAVAAFNEAGVVDKTKILAILNAIVEIVQKSLAARSAELGASLKEMPAVIAQASIVGLKDSGVAADDYDEALKEISETVMDNMDDCGIPAADRDEASGEMIKSSIGSLDELGISKDQMDEMSVAMMAGAVEGIPSTLTPEEIKEILEGMNESVVDGFKDAGLSDAEMAEKNEGCGGRTGWSHRRHWY